MFNDSERSILRETTFHDIIIRNLKIDNDDGSQFVRNLWVVQPNTELTSVDDEEFKTKISPWSLYSIKYRLDSTHIYFKVEIQTSGGEGWFGMVSTIVCTCVYIYIQFIFTINFFLNKFFF